MVQSRVSRLLSHGTLVTPVTAKRLPHRSAPEWGRGLFWAFSYHPESHTG